MCAIIDCCRVSSRIATKFLDGILSIVAETLILDPRLGTEVREEEG